MNHTGNHSGPKNKKKKNENTERIALLDFVEDPKRTVSLVGLQYLVALKLMDSTECLIKCNLCKFKGNDSDMRNHLVGLDHLTSFLEKHYMFLLEDVKHTGFQKPQLELLLREYAREIERLEGTGAINIEVVFESEFRKEQDTWVELTDSAKYRSALHKEFPFYRRKMALSYSRNLKSSSQTEASGLLSLTQQLLNNLEQYYLKCKPPSTPGSSGIISTIATIETPSNMLPSSGNKNNDYTTNLESTIMKSSRDIEEPSTSSMYQSNAEYTHRQFTGHESQIPDTSGYGQVHVEQNAERRGHVFHSSVNDHFSNIEATSESQPSAAPIVSYAKEFINTDETNAIVPDQSSSHTSSSCEQSSEMSSSRHSVGKTSKALSPDILLLLKGKDASTVTNILRTLSPFYPALQDVNLEILGQVLVNTGVLD